jgi:hypothetical protein
MANLKPPNIGVELVPVFTDDELATLLGTCKGGGFQNRHDYAISGSRPIRASEPL